MLLTQRLSASQLATVRLLLKMQLKHPDFDSIKGFEGLVKGHLVLKEKNEAGILVGGLSEDVWNRRRTKDELQQHKDVDIMILGNSHFSDFEAGIDWWLPIEERIDVKGDISAIYGSKIKTWQNAMGTILPFGIDVVGKLPPGLYIQEPQWVVSMREHEAVTMHGNVGEEIISEFGKRIEKRMGTILPKYLKDVFGEFVAPTVRLVDIDREIYLALKHKGV